MSGKLSTGSLGGHKCFVVFLDDASAMSGVYFITKKSQFIECLQAYKAFTENETGRRMLGVRLDGAGEQRSNEIVELINKSGMKLEYSPPYASQSNGASKRLVQELWKMARSMLFDSTMDMKLWAETISHANWLRNRLPSKRIDMQIPFTKWYNEKPDVSNLLAFGTKGNAYQYRSDTARNKKFLPRALYGNFVGMESKHALYRIYITSLDTVRICRKDDFHQLQADTNLPTFQELTSRISQQQQLEEENEIDDDDNQTAQDSLSACYFAHYSNIPIAMKTKIRDPRIPSTFAEARKIPQWATAIDKEFNALNDRETWRYIPRTDDMKPLPFIWDFRIKDTHGSLASYLCKARCCLRGDKQLQHRDYDPLSLYAPVARHETIRMFLTKAAALNLFVEGADVDNAYLYGLLDRPIIMEQPTDSSGIPKHPNHVCLLLRSLYGAKQAGEIWGSVLHYKFIEWGFVQSSQDQRLYFKKDGDSFMDVIIVVDDIAFASNNNILIETFKQKLTSAFKVKLMGQLKSFIGWQLRYTEKGIYVHQPKYIERMLQLHNFSHVTPVDTPLPVKGDFSTRHDDEARLSKNEHHRYRSIVGSLAYLSLCTRPDISFAISILYRQLHDPCERHLVLAKRVVRYIKGTSQISLLFPRDSNSAPLEAYSDSDWAGCHETRRSTTGMVIKVNNAPVYWSSKRQSTVALSSSEAEYIALSSCAKQITWMRRLFNELLTSSKLEDEPHLHPSSMYTDSQSALSLTLKQAISERNKHIEMKCHHVKDLIKKRIVKLSSIRTWEQPANFLTKPVSYPQLKQNLKIINML